MTFPEVLVAVVLLATFCASIFELNAVCLCKKATEVVKISAYPTANGVTQFTRTPDGAVSNDLTAADLGTSLVQVDVSTSWNMLGGRARSESTSTIISNGTKK
jgi:hypothetical protein